MRTFAGIASLPGRPLERAVRSLRGQVDEIGVYLNGYNTVPTFLHELKCHVAFDHTNRGSSAKLKWASMFDGLYFACDDDLEYPPDYVAQINAEWERWGSGVIVTACGRTLRPDAKRWQDWTGPHRYVDAVPEARWINYMSGGCSAFHTSFRLPAIEPPNEEEAVLSTWAQREQVPIRLIARPYDWPKRIPLAPGAFTLYAVAAKERFATRSRIIQTVSPWVVHHPVGAEVA